MKKLLILLGVVGASFSAIFVRYSTAPSLTLVFWRMVLSCALLLPVIAVKNRTELRRVPGRTLCLCAVSGVFLGLHFASYFESLRFTSIGSAVVLADTEVFFVALAGLLIWREKLSARALLGIAVTFAGSVIVAASGGGNGSDPLRGNLLALGSAAAMVVYTLIGRAVRKTQSTNVYTFLVYGFAGLTVALLGLFSGQNMAVVTGRDVLIALGLAIFSTLLGHSVYSWGLKYESATFISTAKLLEPVLAALLGLAFFAERPGFGTLIGGPLIIGGIWWYSRYSRK